MKYNPILIITAIMLTACSDDIVPGNIEPLLSVAEATDITRTEATLAGTVVLKGNTPMPELHFIYGETEDMNNETAATADSDNNVSVRISGLTPGTLYNYCLTGTNGRVTIYSNTMTFTTQHSNRPVLSALTILSHGPTSAIVSYEITDDGGEDITETGCYITNTSTGETTKMETTSNDTNSTYRMRLGGLEQNTEYEFTAFASNKEGETKGEPLQFKTSNAIILQEAGELDELVGDDIYEYSTLSIDGQINGDDIRCLREMMGRDINGDTTPGQLTDVNLADASIVEGGGSYGSSRYTENNVISYGMFADCTDLTNIVLPDNTTAIENEAFSNCTSLKQLTIPASVSSVTPSSGCTSLMEINVSAANINYTSVEGVLFSADGQQLTWFPIGKDGDYTLPSTVTEIGDYAFRDCNITNFTLPDNLTEIGQAVFYGSKVEEVDMPDKLRLIPTGTFQNCSQLKTIRLGSATELISDYAFDGCPLRDMYIDAKYPPVCNPEAFTNSASDMFSTCVLHVPAGRKTAYRYDADWGQFKNITEQ